jgi:hypothetical protein
MSEERAPTMFAHLIEDNGMMGCIPHVEYDDEAAFRKANPKLTLGEWQWRLPNPILDAFTLPTYPQARMAAIMDGEEQIGWLFDPDTEPPEDEVKAHKKRLQDAAIAALQAGRESSSCY